MATSAGPGAFLFTGAVQTQVEGAGAALVTVHRLSGALGTVSVRVTSSNGTASAGSDYTAVNQILTFTNGVTSQTFSLPVADDGLIESNETVFLSLSNPTGGAVLAQPSTATLVILDNDEPLNNSAATAQPVVLNSAFASVLTGAGSVPLALSPFNDSDWFSFSAPANGRVWAMVDVGATSNPAANSGDSRLALLALDGSTVLEDDDDDGSATGCDGVLASDGGLAPALAGSAVGGAGTYYLRVDPVSTNAIIDPYHLLLAVTPAAVLAEGEPNDTANAATVLLDLATAVASRSAAIDGAGDIDYFAVAAPSNALLFVAADCDPERDGGTDLVVELLDVDGSTVLFSADSSSDEVAAAEAFCFRVGARGTYFLRVSHYDPAETGTYHIMAARDRTDLAVVWAHVEGANVRVRFTTESGVTYRVERANGIGSSWSTLPGSVSGTGNEGEYLDLGGAAGGQRFYRVRRGP
jgi:hypothetical protein